MMPQQVILYRDGVGDGQLQAVEQYEMPQLRRAFNFWKVMSLNQSQLVESLGL